MNRRLYRCRDNRVLAGVAAGVAEYFDLDPTLVRVLWFISIFFGGLTLVLYIGLAFIMPLEPISAAGAATAGDEAPGDTAVVPEGHRHTTRRSGQWTTLIGYALVLFGTLVLIDQVLPGLELERLIVPAFAIGIGAFLIRGAVRREPSEL
ncbi:MAG TPA: PspC domain-containing protein [Candidatus Eisenbacteria bacterium]|nr:PspC domain-containing protein [Candidatus Eisenbacteria bacterium]